MPPSPPPSRHLIVANPKAVFGWAFTLLWLGALALGTPSYIQSRGSTGVARGDIVIACFWLFGLGAAVFFLRIPRTTVRIDGRHVVVTERWIVGAREHRLSRAESARVALKEATDTDGLRYFICELTTPSGRVISIAEGHQFEDVDAQRRALVAAFAADEPQTTAGPLEPT